jgi:hypothetical protein
MPDNLAEYDDLAEFVSEQAEHHRLNSDYSVSLGSRYIDGFSYDGDEPPSSRFYRSERIDHPGRCGIPPPPERKHAPRPYKSDAQLRSTASSLQSVDKLYHKTLSLPYDLPDRREWLAKKFSPRDQREILSLSESERFAIRDAYYGRRTEARFTLIPDECNYHLATPRRKAWTLPA